MSFEALRAELTQRFQTGFVNAADPPASFIPVAYENVSFKQPSTTWGRLTIQQAGRDNAAVGTGFQRTPGALYLQIFSPEDGGTRLARQAADKLAEVFDNLSFSFDGGDVIFRCVELVTVGKTREGWYQQNAVVGFWFDERTA